jgi:hypothetical protein
MGAWGSSVLARAPEDQGLNTLGHHGYILTQAPDSARIHTDQNSIAPSQHWPAL